MTPGKANESARGVPFCEEFYYNFSPHNNNNDNDIQCCMYKLYDGMCCISDFDGTISSDSWDGMERMRYGGTVGMLLDLDEGTLSVYMNGRELGVMKRGLAGPYCWVVSIYQGVQVAIRRGTPRG